MRPKFLIFLFVAGALILAILFWLRPVKPTVTSQQGPVQVTNASMSSNGAANQSAPINGASPTNSTAVSKPSPPITRSMTLEEVTTQFIESKNKPIEFYGKVIDQDSNALAGAMIRIGIRHWTMPDSTNSLVGSKTIELEQTSDTDGRFEFHGETGDGFGVGITKDGYELEQNKFGSGPTAGSYDNPVIFKMWSTNIHERLITGGKSFQIVPDGRPYFINLTDDTISESGHGDMKVWIQYTNQVVSSQLYDWSAGIEVLNGGLLEESLGMAMYEAPASGYTNAFEFSGQIKGGQRGDIGERQFYLQLNNGQEYGQMSIDLIAPFNNQTPGLISLSYAINPSGSRILR